MESLPPEQPKELHVKTCVERDGILVEITNNGPGIPTEVQNRMFEPFFTTKPLGKGTGLGLDIVQRIIRNHKDQSVSSRTPAARCSKCVCHSHSNVPRDPSEPCRLSIDRSTDSLVL